MVHHDHEEDHEPEVDLPSARRHIEGIVQRLLLALKSDEITDIDNHPGQPYKDRNKMSQNTEWVVILMKGNGKDRLF